MINKIETSASFWEQIIKKRNFDEKYYIVWNIRSKTYAVISDPDTDGNIVFPCVASKLESWLETTNLEESEECYDWDYAGDKVNPTSGTTPYLSENTGCGDLWNTWERVIDINQPSDCDPDPIQGSHYKYTDTEYMPAYNDQTLIVQWSILLSVSTNLIF